VRSEAFLSLFARPRQTTATAPVGLMQLRLHKEERSVLSALQTRAADLVSFVKTYTATHVLVRNTR